MKITLLSIFLFITICRCQVLEKCKEEEYPPGKNDRLVSELIDLDLPPAERWSHIVKPRKEAIIKFLDYARSFLPSPVRSLAGKVLGEGLDKVPSPYKEEMIGIADDIEVSKGEIFAGNIFYELEKLCTSIVTRDSNGNIYHARNMDLGALLGWDSKQKSWKIAELLRPLVANIEFQRNKTTVYKTVQFVGSVGAFTGVAPGRFSVSLNSRSAGSMFEGPWNLMKWMYYNNDNSRFASFWARTVLDKAASYENAMEMLSTEPLLASVYYIIGGVEGNQGAIISRSPKENVRPLSFASSNGWYLVQTNYDYWKKAPFYDDRRTPAKICLNSSGNSISNNRNHFKILYNVLSTIPVLNKATIYTALLSAKQGKMETYKRSCPGLCYPW